jgi:hypothetical protein
VKVESFVTLQCQVCGNTIKMEILHNAPVREEILKSGFFLSRDLQAQICPRCLMTIKHHVIVWEIYESEIRQALGDDAGQLLREDFSLPHLPNNSQVEE